MRLDAKSSNIYSNKALDNEHFIQQSVQWIIHLPCKPGVAGSIPGFSKINLYILFAITAADVVPCSGSKTSHRTSSIVHIFYLGPLRSVKNFRVFKTRLETYF